VKGSPAAEKVEKHCTSCTRVFNLPTLGYSTFRPKMHPYSVA